VESGEVAYKIYVGVRPRTCLRRRLVAPIITNYYQTDRLLFVRYVFTNRSDTFMQMSERLSSILTNSTRGFASGKAVLRVVLSRARARARRNVYITVYR